MSTMPERALLRRLVEAHRTVLGAGDLARDVFSITAEAETLLAQPAPECAGPFADVMDCPKHRGDKLRPAPEGEDATTRYERLAEAFYRDTGLMAPGKDVSAAMGSADNDERRAVAWKDWMAKRAPVPLSRAEAEARVAGLAAIQSWLSLHRQAELWYTVDGYNLDLTDHDGATVVHRFEGKTVERIVTSAALLRALTGEAP